MTFCWFTSFIGYPNFFKNEGDSYELGQAFLTLAEAALAGKSYSAAKGLFTDLDPAQVETKKAAFQEFGLLYVVPRSNTLTLTPVGQQIYDLVADQQSPEKNRRTILLALSRALSRYQFNNPLPVGGNRLLNRAKSSDVLPYLACYYLMLKLDGVITVSELKGAVFSLQHMSNIRMLESNIRDHRKSTTPFPELSSLPANKRTSDNLKIYFMSHLRLDGEIIQTTTANYYGIEEQAFELTEFGYEITESVLTEQWQQWKNSASSIPSAKSYTSVESYFTAGVGQACPTATIEADIKRAEDNSFKLSEGVLDQYDVEDLKELPRRIFQEGTRRLVQHERLEKVRNSPLVREAKRLFKKKHGRLFCEVCSFDFESKYGTRGKDYIEAHHKLPISEFKGPVSLTVDDLAMVCSNCHRMFHRPPWITIDELLGTIKQS